jgi:hypothetical protein
VSILTGVRKLALSTWFGVLVAVLVAASAPVGSASALSGSSARSLSASLSSSRSVLLGVSSGSVAAAAAFGGAKGAGLVNLYASFASKDFDARAADQVAAEGALPMVTLLPCLDGTLGAEQPAFSLRRIAGGDFDRYLRRWAAGAAAWRHPLMLRFAPEMNGSWNPWSAGVNGNSSHDFVLAWRHIHALFDRSGATNVEWVWSPNVVMAASPSLASLYPGDQYVDWVGIDGYNWGTSRPHSRWQSFAQIFAQTLQQVRSFTSKPLMLSEVGSAESGGSKAAWLEDFFVQLRRNPDILAFVWFDFKKEADWRVASSPASARAFATGITGAWVRGAESPAAASSV